MAVCSITLKGIDFSCKDTVGGLKNVWLADWNTAGVALTTDGNRVSVDGAKFKLFRFRTGNASMNSTLNADEANGTVFVTTDLNMKFTKLTEDSRKEIAEILKGNVAAVVQDNNNNYFVLGLDHPLTLSAGSVNTGSGLGDFAGYDITVQDYSSTLPYFLDESDIADLPTSVG